MGWKELNWMTPEGILLWDKAQPEKTDLSDKKDLVVGRER